MPGREPQTMSPPVLTGLRQIADTYDGVIVDLWGTLHNGVAPYPGAVEALQKLVDARACVAVLSNAPRRAANVAQSMAKFGLRAGGGCHVFSSGEEAWVALAERGDDWYRSFGRNCYYLGPARDRAMLDNPGLVEAARIEDADFILCTGVVQPQHDVADYEAVLTDAVERSLPMVCANPDYVVMRGSERELCAGALAVHYEDTLGGSVRWHGKPHPSVYRSCMALMDVGDPARVIMIGDSLRTDIAGAARLGMASAFIPGGIHGEAFHVGWGEVPDETVLADAFTRDGARPTFVLPAFAW